MHVEENTQQAQNEDLCASAKQNACYLSTGDAGHVVTAQSSKRHVVTAQASK